MSTVRQLTIRSLPARRSLPLFLALVACLAFWQVWLTWRSMEQERNLTRRQARDCVNQGADLAVAQPASRLARWDFSLCELDRLPLRLL
jgi:hypothetical protein